MHLDDALDLALADVCECNVISVQEREARIVILEIAGLAHTGRILVNEAEDAFVTAGLLFIHQSRAEFKPDVNIAFFLAEAVVFDLAAAHNRKLYLFFAKAETVVENIVDLVRVDRNKYVTLADSELVAF
jgi:hypothetical protein